MLSCFWRELTDTTQICDQPGNFPTLVAVAQDKVFTSVDGGTTWISYVNTPEPASAAMAHTANSKSCELVFALSNFILASGHTILTSPDGITDWQVQTSTLTDALFYLCSFDVEEMGIVFTGGSYGGKAAVSQALETWDESATIEVAGADEAYCGAYGNSLYVIAGYGDHYLTTPDLIDFTGGSGITDQGYIFTMTYGPQGFIAGGLGARLSGSANGTSWTPLSTGLTAGNAQTILCSMHDGTQYVIGTRGGKILASANGTSWTEKATVWGGHLTGWDSAVYAITHASGLYAISGSAGKVAVSSDLESWTNVPVASNYDVMSIAAKPL